jgi:hypothetical protein
VTVGLQELRRALGRGEPADRPHPPAPQQSPGISARLGRQDLLHAAPNRPLLPRALRSCCRPCWGRLAGLRSLKQLAIERTEGNPFFLEESVRTLVEIQALVGQRGAYRPARGLPNIQVPATAQTVLGAHRAAAAGGERLLLTAAVIGMEVAFAWLQALGDMPEDALRLGLTHLQAAECLYETRLFPDLEYTFTHALTHGDDVAPVSLASLCHWARVQLLTKL